MKASLVGAPKVTAKALLVAGVNVPLVAVKVYPVPALSRLNPLKVATPVAAARVAVPERLPLAGFVPIAKATEAVEVVTVLPPASWIVTTGDVAKAIPETAAGGWVVKASLAAGPSVMLNVPLVAEVRLAEVAVRV